MRFAHGVCVCAETKKNQANGNRIFTPDKMDRTVSLNKLQQLFIMQVGDVI